MVYHYTILYIGSVAALIAGALSTLILHLPANKSQAGKPQAVTASGKGEECRS
jgi:hypothetical protein